MLASFTRAWTSQAVRPHTRLCPILHQASDLIAEPRGEVIEVKAVAGPQADV